MSTKDIGEDRVPLSLDEIKQIELKILLEIHDICEREKIKYSLAGGSLLGAVRHGGFIPWDDDIDIIMPRQDYLKFLSYCEENEVGFFVQNCNNTQGYGKLFSKACAPGTVVVDEYKVRSPRPGVFVDIFPVDNLGDSKQEAKRVYRRYKASMSLLVAANWGAYVPSKTRGILFEPIRLALFCLSRFMDPGRLARKIDASIQCGAKDGALFSGCLCGVYGEREALESSVYSDIGFMEFEGRKVCALLGYDKYLSALYGDYMKLPPVEKRVSQHALVAYRTLSE